MKTKTLITALVALAATQIAALADFDLGYKAGSTPYEPYMAPVKNTLARLNGDAPSMDRVKELMKVGRGFRYSFTEPYVAALPEVTASKRAGDCKAKSLWLCAMMGDENVRFVIGKTKVGAKLSHAWVMWENNGKWWILDPTKTSKPIDASSVPSDRYVPLYSYGKNSAYRHMSTRMMVASTEKGTNAAVAAEKSEK